jgi:hypothetical protein
MNSSGTVVRIMIGASVVNGIKQKDKSRNATLEKSSKEQLARPASLKVLIHSCVVVPGRLPPLFLRYELSAPLHLREQAWSKEIFTKMLTKKKN